MLYITKPVRIIHQHALLTHTSSTSTFVGAAPIGLSWLSKFDCFTLQFPMIPKPSITTLFHELFDADWPDDDPQFLEEVEKYGKILRRMLAADSELSHHIQLQSLLDNNQIAAVPVMTGVKKSQFVASVEPFNQQYLFQCTSSPLHLTDIFSSIRLDAGHEVYQNSPSDKDADSMKTQFDTQGLYVTVTCTWKGHILQLSPAMQKFMGCSVAVHSAVAHKLLAHIDARSLSRNGDVKCDAILKNLAGRDEFHITDLHKVIDQNTKKLEPLTFTLNVPSARKGFAVTIPDVSGIEDEFKPMRVQPAPIREFLETAIESKEQLKALRTFETEPEAFVEEAVVREARMQKPDEFVGSTYYFLQPWVAETAPDMLKASEYLRRRRERPVNVP